MASSEPLVPFLTARGVPEKLAEALLKAPYCCTTVRQFAYGFKSKDDLRARFCEAGSDAMLSAFQDNLGQVAEVLAAWEVSGACYG